MINDSKSFDGPQSAPMRLPPDIRRGRRPASSNNDNSNNSSNNNSERSPSPTSQWSRMYRRSQTPPPRLDDPSEHYISCWQTSATTPMTSRPHFFHHPIDLSPPQRRMRSRSLGSADERLVHSRRQQQRRRRNQQQQQQLDEYPVQFDDWRDFLLPPTLHSERQRGSLLLPWHGQEQHQVNHSASTRVGFVKDNCIDSAAATRIGSTNTTTSTNTQWLVPPPLQNDQETPLLPSLELNTTATGPTTTGGGGGLTSGTDDENEYKSHGNKNPNENGTSSKETITTDIEDDSVAQTSTRKSEKTASHDNPAWLCVMYGLINATIVLPVLMSFASIIYRDPAFAAAMPTLVKLTLVSGMIHQVCFSTFSSLPFAVGQVQDAGLIFLSSMATSIVEYCRARQYDLQVVLATATIVIPLATAFLGVALIVLGRWELAQYVQLLPTSVVGGYLAYIGWFCGMAGVGLMAGGASDVSLALVSEQWYLIVPGVSSGLLLYVSVRTLRHMAVLPCGILMLLIMFYVVVWCRGTSLQDVTDQGWIRQTDTDSPLLWTDTWNLMKFNKVAWGVMPQLLLTELSMIFVVALSSSLDVAAIEIELQQPLDYNHELQTVGLSNLVSGLTGGYTGSYIFSQSIFSLRAGIRSRLAGFVLAICQLIVFLLPFPILAFVPNFFFGALLSLICVDLLYEWLWQVRDKVTAVEYVICLSTFGLIQCTGVEYGILLGVVMYLALRKAGCNVGNKTDTAEQDGAEQRDTLVPMRKEGDFVESPESGQYGSLI